MFRMPVCVLAAALALPAAALATLAAVLAVLAAAPTLPAAAQAQQPTPVIGNFGGGALLTAPASPFSPGTMVIGLRAGGGPTVRITATVAGRCASGSFAAEPTVAADGTFSASGEVRQRSIRTRYELQGTLSERPSGMVTARFKRSVGERTTDCSAQNIRWEAREAPGGFGEPAAVTPDATLFGTTAQRHKGARRGIVLRISPDGRAISRAVYAVTLRCTGDVRSLTYDLPRDDLAIGADGRFSDRESGRRRTKTAILRYVERFAGNAGSTGAEGFLSSTVTIRRRSTGRRIARCRSGGVRWSATY
jgi:hypothetical protein